MFRQRLGQILGLFSSVAVIMSVFLSFISVDFLGYSIFEMSLFKYNVKAAAVIAVLGLLAFIASYAIKGFLSSLIGIIIFGANFLFAATLTTGNPQIDEGIKMVNGIFGNMIQPGVGFLVAAGGSILLFLAGVLMNKGKAAVV